MLYTYKLCRLCLSSGGRLIDIFEENNNLEFMIANTIEELLQLKVTKETGFPWFVCSSCLEKLTEFRFFKHRCVECQLVFNNRVRNGNFLKAKNCNSKTKKGREVNEVSSNDFGEGTGEDNGMPPDLWRKSSVLESTASSDVEPKEAIGSLAFGETETDPFDSCCFEGMEIEMPVKEEECVDASETMFEVMSDDWQAFVKDESEQPEASSDTSASAEIPVEDKVAAASEALLDEGIVKGEVADKEGCSEGETSEAEAQDDNHTSASLEVPVKEVDAEACPPLDKSLATGGRDRLAETTGPVRDTQPSNGHRNKRISCSRSDKNDEMAPVRGDSGKGDLLRNARMPLRGPSSREGGSDVHVGEELSGRIGVGATSSDILNAEGMDEMKSMKGYPADVSGRASTAVFLTREKTKVSGFRCDVCGRDFRTKGAIFKHLKEGHRRSKLLHLGVCGTELTKKEKLRKHNSNLREGNRLIRQRVEGKGNDKNKVRRRRKDVPLCEGDESRRSARSKTASESPHVCPECSKDFKLKSSLQRHLWIHSGVKPYPCETCSKSFTRKSRLQSHMSIHSDGRPFVCKVCSKCYALKDSLRIHMMDHNNANAFACGTCSKSFTRKSYLQSHMLIHSGTRPFACETCSKTFAHKSSLRTHKLIHSDVRPFVCDQCSMSFARKFSLRYHMHVHSGARPFVCKVCSKSYTVKDSLRVHMMVHSNLRPFVCDQCFKSFSLKTSLRRHTAIHSSK